MTDIESGTPTSTRDLVYGLVWILGLIVVLVGVIGLVLAGIGFFSCGCLTQPSPA